MASIETTWSIITGQELDPGNLVQAGLLDKLGGNHNLLLRRYTAPLGSAVFAVPLQPGSAAGSYVDHLRFAVPASADARGVVANVRWDPGATDGGVRLYSMADGAKVATAPLSGGAGPQLSTLRIGPSDGVRDTFVLAAAGLDTLVYSVSLAWAQDTTGTLASLAPLDSGAAWVNTSATGETEPESDDDKPVTDELLNRMLTLPRILYGDRRGVLFGAFDDMLATRRWKVTGSSSRTLVIGVFLPVRYPVRVRWYVQPEDVTTSWYVRVVDSFAPSAYVQISEASASELWGGGGGATWYKAASTVLYDRGDHLFDVELYASPGTLSLNSLVAIIEET